jgi:hypothetical protein
MESLLSRPEASTPCLSPDPASMQLLPILFWILLILAIIGVWAPPPYQVWGFRLALVLFVILGLRVFPISLN